MKIISPYKDYYDYLAHQYGIDESITYVRKQINFEHLNIFSNDKFAQVVTIETVRVDLPRLPDSIFSNSTKTITFGWLFCAGYLYLLVGDSGGMAYDVFTPQKYPQLVSHITVRDMLSHCSISDYVGIECKQLIPLAKLLRQPVFVIARRTGSRFDKIARYGISSYVPVLSHLGMAPIVPPQEIYRRIYHFILDELHESPDTKPPIEVSNNTKIEQHGFDLDASFRHRK